MPNFKVAITTRNREQLFYKCYNEILRHVSANDIIVVDDCSDNTYFNANYRFNNRVGIPTAKNKCIELFMQSYYEHLFLLDDDIYPLCDNSFQKYINLGVNHACYTFGEPKFTAMGYNVHYSPNGCMMYFNRKCFDIVGGFDTRYGLGKFEHNELTRRIHNAGLTLYECIDIIDSDKLFYSFDRNKEVKRTFSEEEDSRLVNENMELFFKDKYSAEYKPYELPTHSKADGLGFGLRR